MKVIATQGDTVDALCYRVYGKTKGMTELVYQANQGLAKYGPILPIGLIVEMPEKAIDTEQKNIVQLWD